MQVLAAGSQKPPSAASRTLTLIRASPRADGGPWAMPGATPAPAAPSPPSSGVDFSTISMKMAWLQAAGQVTRDVQGPGEAVHGGHQACPARRQPVAQLD